MGITFRSGGFPKHVFFGGRTVKDGEALAIWNRWGVHRQIVGPSRVRLFSSTIRFLTRHKAEPDQYIRVAHRDGRVEHIQGPANLYENPALHDEVSVHDGIRLHSSSECVILHKNLQDTLDFFSGGNANDKFREAASLTKNVMVQPSSMVNENTIVSGPCLFIPQPEDEVHTFCWSSITNKDKEKFHVLNTSNCTWCVPLDIPTNDGFSFKIKLVIEYHINSVDNVMMMKDPISKLYSALSADSQVIGERISSKMLRNDMNDQGIIDPENQINQRQTQNKSTITKELSTLETYTHFKSVVSKCGFAIDSLRITEFKLCNTLQSFVLKEQEASAELSSEYAEKSNRRAIHELELKEKHKSIEDKAALERMQRNLDEKLSKDSQEMKLAEMDRKLEIDKKIHAAKVDMLKENDKLVLDFLKAMKDEVGVDMTKFMTSVGTRTLVNPILHRSDILKPPGNEPPLQRSVHLKPPNNESPLQHQKN